MFGSLSSRLKGPENKVYTKNFLPPFFEACYKNHTNVIEKLLSLCQKWCVIHQIHFTFDYSTGIANPVFQQLCRLTRQLCSNIWCFSVGCSHLGRKAFICITNNFSLEATSAMRSKQQQQRYFPARKYPNVWVIGRWQYHFCWLWSFRIEIDENVI